MAAEVPHSGFLSVDRQPQLLTFGSTVTFTQRPMGLGLSQPTTEHIRSSKPARFHSTGNFGFRTPISLVTAFSELHCRLRFFPTNPSFPLSFHRCQACMMVWSLSLPTPTPSSFMLYSHLPISCMSNPSSKVLTLGGPELTQAVTVQSRDMEDRQGGAYSSVLQSCLGWPIYKEIPVSKHPS